MPKHSVIEVVEPEEEEEVYSHVKLQTFVVVHHVALIFFMVDYPASG
jgi:hypothetical protein